MPINNDFTEKLTGIWENNIKEDYKNELLSYEADLQASLYMHLREKLEKNYKIYLEQEKFDESGTPDIIVCDHKERERKRKIKCILELKYLPHTRSNKGLSDMKKLENIHNYFKNRENKCAIWMEGPHRTDEFNNNDQKKWDEEHWEPHFIDDDAIFGFVLIAPGTIFKDNAGLINEFLEKDKNYLVLAGKTYITQKGKCDFRVLSGK